MFKSASQRSVKLDVSIIHSLLVFILFCALSYIGGKKKIYIYIYIYIYIIILLPQKMQSNRIHGNCCLFDSITSNLPMMPCSLIPDKNK